MTEPTTDRPAIEVEPDPADIVDTPRWPGAAHFPPISAVPRDSAVEAVGMAQSLRAGILAYREAIRPVLEVDAVDTAGPVEDCAEIRRRMGMLTDTLIRRALSPESVIIAAHAQRVAERVAGLTLRATPPVLVPRPRDVFGDAAGRCRAMGAPTDEEFDAAVGMCAARGDVSYDAVAAMLDRGDVPAAEREQVETIVRLAERGQSPDEVAAVLALDVDTVKALSIRHDIVWAADVAPAVFTADDTIRAVTAVVDLVSTAGGTAQVITPAMVDALDRAQCADWSRDLWETAKYVLQLRARLDARGKG